MAASVAVMHEPAAMERPPVMQSLLQASSTKPAWPSRARQPTMRRHSIDDKGDIDEARPGRHIGEVGEPKRFGRGALNWRLTWSSGHGVALSLIVVLTGLPRITPAPIPASAATPATATSSLRAELRQTCARHTRLDGGRRSLQRRAHIKGRFSYRTHLRQPAVILFSPRLILSRRHDQPPHPLTEPGFK